MDIIVTLCYFILTSGKDDRRLLKALRFCVIFVLLALEMKKESWGNWRWYKPN